MSKQFITHSQNTVISIRSYQAQSHTHSHNFGQLVLPLTGNLELEIASQAEIVNKDRAAFIRPGINHSFSSRINNKFLILDILPANNWINIIPAFWDLTPTLKKFLNFAQYFLSENSECQISSAMLQDFLIKLLLKHFLSPYDSKVFQAKNWMDNNFEKSIDLKQISKVCHLSVSQLQRRFKEALGQSLGQYWRTIKLQQAKNLLVNSNLSIEAIALCVGYENLSAFSRCFLKTHDCSPSKWRHMLLSAQKMPLSGKN